MATTTFVDDETVVVADYNTSVSGYSGLAAAPTDIKEFFAKPWLVYQGSWSSATLLGASILPLTTGFATDNLLISNPLWASKWSGFSLVRSTIKVRLQINASPFHSGKLLMHFLPLAISMDAMGAAYSAMHNFNITTKTMQPCVELDCRETSAIIEIPYIAPTDHYVLNPSGGTTTLPIYPRGSVNVSVLSPLSTGVGGSPTVDWSLYVSFEDVELSAPIVPQMDRSSKMKKKKNVPEAELAVAKNGTISGALSVASSIASSLGSVPMLSELAIPASWVFQGAASIASWFGYSKPTNNTSTTLVTIHPQRYSATSDGTDNAYPLSLRSDNSVTLVTNKSLTTQDEMSFAFLKGVSAMINYYSWSTSQPSGTQLTLQLPGSTTGAGSLRIFPSNLYQSGSVTRGATTVTACTGPPIWYLSTQFRYYRGSIVITLKFAKTDYHSGRLQVTFTPKPSPVLPTLTTGMYAMQQIVDLRLTNEMEMTLPYMLPTHYSEMDSSMGVLDIKVLTQLTAPDAVSVNIPVLLYVRAGEDFEFAAPGLRPGITQYVPFSPQMDTSTRTEISSILSKGTVGGGADIKPATSKFAEHSMGEMFTSIRQILLRYHTLYFKTAFTATTVDIWPWFVSCMYITTLGRQSPSIGGDPFSFYAPMYAFYRGSMKIQALTQKTWVFATLNTKSVVAGATPIQASGSILGTSAVVDYINNPTTTITSGLAIMNTSNGNQFAVQVPYYCKTPVSLIHIDGTGVIPVSGGSVETSAPTVAVTLSDFISTSPIMSRAIGEDFQFLYFVGCPPLVTAVTS